MAFNSAAFRLPMGIYINANKPIDLKYGPYLGTGTEEGHAFHVDSPVFAEGVRHKGLTIGVEEGGNIVEYWWPNGLANTDLVPKTSGSEGTVKSVNNVLPDGAGNVLLTKTHITLGNVDNTSDIDKPVSTAQQAAIDAAIAQTIRLQGDWDANTNTPLLPGVDLVTTGFAWRVSVAGNTNLGGISNWGIGDLAVKVDGDNDAWIRTDAQDISSVWGNIGGDITAQTDLVAALAAKEAVLGNPLVDGYVLSSAIDGTRTWIPMSATNLYTSAMDPTTTTPEDHGGIPSNTTAGSLTGQSISAILDMILFPTTLAYISQNKSISISLSGGSTTMEVGSNVDVSITSTFVKGSIRDGDGSLNPNPLVGDAISYLLIVDGVDDLSNATGTFNKNIDIAHGSNDFNVEVTHAVGTGAYYDNKGVAGTNLDSQRIATTIKSSSKDIDGRYKFWYGFDRTVNDSDDVRALSSAYLGSSNTGTFVIVLDATVVKTSFAVISGSDVTVLYVESSNADITATFVKTPITVEDAGGNNVSYDLYEATLAGPYGVNATYRITIL